jgi:hypothetical protein
MLDLVSAAIEQRETAQTLDASDGRGIDCR